MRIPLFSFKGYAAPDPLDKAPTHMRFLLLSGINLVLTIGLLYLITANKVVAFNGFRVFGLRFPPLATMVLEVLINAGLYTAAIVWLRKSSSLYLYLLVLLPYYLLDLFYEGRYRCDNHPEKALWNYFDGSVVSGIHPAAFKFFVTLSVDALLFGVVSLYLARLLAAALYKHKPYPPQPTKQQYDDLFKPAWSDEEIKRPARGLGFTVLRLLGFGYLAYLSVLVLGLMGSSPWPKALGTLIDMTYKNPALAINTYFKIALMVMLTFLAAYNRSLRYYACAGLLVGHLLSTVYSLSFYFAKDLHASDSGFLLTSAIVDGGMIVIFFFVMQACRKERGEYAPDNDMPAHFSTPLSLQNVLYKVLAAGFAVFALAIVLYRVVDEGRYGFGAIFGFPDPMVGNTVTLYGTLSLLAFLQVKRRKLRDAFFNPLLVPLFFGSAVALLWVIAGDARGGWVQTRHVNENGEPVKVPAYWYFILFACFNLLVSYLLIASRTLLYRIDYAINALSPSGAANAMAIEGCLFDADARQQAVVLKAIDQYAGGIAGRRRGLLNLPFSLFENVLNFLYGFHPPFSTMSREEQRYFLRKYFLRPAPERRTATLPQLADFAFTIGVSLNTFMSFAHYSGLKGRSDIGYVPADARDRLSGAGAAYPPPHKGLAPLPKDHRDPLNFAQPATAKEVAPRVTTPVCEPGVPDEADYLVIGSGAGGAVMAYRLACESDAKILVVERGQRYQPLQDFTDNEMEMIRKVYKEGGLQQTKRADMTVLQGECLGGTTVINNAVCFSMPDAVFHAWQNTFGIDLSNLQREYRRIADEISIQRLGNDGVNRLVRARFEQAVNAYNAATDPTNRLLLDGPVFVNHLNTVGDGNWNLGNKRMLKRSMLETYLPWSEARGVELVSNMTAMRFHASQGGRVESVVLRSGSGGLFTVKVRKAVIVAGGALASSHFLMRSDVRHLPVGQRLSGNFALPVAFDFEDSLKAYDGDQITMSALDPQNRCVFETYFNPPASFALASMPFFFHRRKELMSRYINLLNFGCLVGSEPNGRVLPKAEALNGLPFEWELGATDVVNIRHALTTLLQLGLYAGGQRAVLPTKPGLEIALTEENVASFAKAIAAYPLTMDELYMGTAHPQGGNVMAGAGYGNRVVDENFRVIGYRNLYVADASLFPTSLTVNPQWTIMAFSSMASQKVLQAQ